MITALRAAAAKEAAAHKQPPKAGAETHPVTATGPGTPGGGTPPVGPTAGGGTAATPGAGAVGQLNSHNKQGWDPPA
eukprot:11093784-Heterocapsa_arctica.AAC.1